MELVLGIGIFQLIVALYLVFTSSKKHKATTYLYFLFGFGLIHLSIKAIILFGLKDPYLFYNFPTGFTYGYGLFFYLYVDEYFNPSRKKIKPQHRLHLIIFALVFLFYIIEAGFVLATHDKTMIQSYRKFIVLVLATGIFSYFTLSLVILFRQKKEFPALKTSINRLMALAMIMLGLTFFINVFASVFLRPIIHDGVFFRICTYGAIIVFLIGLLQHHLKYVGFQMATPVSKKEGSKEKYGKSGLQNAALENLAVQLEQLMTDKRLYLNTELTLNDLAQALKVPKHYVTELLNDHFKQNFYQYINLYRIQAVERKLKRDPEKNIIDIAFDCGFTSKSSFNTYFKNIIGLTPTQYRSQILNAQT